MSTSAAEEYARQGFAVLPGLLSGARLDEMEGHFLDLVARYGGRRFESATGPDFADFLAADRELERKVYDKIREFSWLLDVASDERLATAIRALIGPDIGVLGKVVFRIDLPMVTRELAVWHQDHFYVRGNTDIVTAWIPLQDTAYELGCLMVMPGSHRHGPVAHDRPLLGKKFVPSTIFQNPVQYVEMQRGDVLLFHSLLLHSSGMNVSDRTRFSIQARYSPLTGAVDPQMGGLVPL